MRGLNMITDKKIENLIRVNRLYDHVYKLEGFRNPLRSLEKLEEAADYILNEFDRYGLRTSEHTFPLEGFDHQFRNIVADLQTNNPPNKPPILITAHYDTTNNTPGADDNASAVAVMLETARVLQSLNFDHPVKFIGFCLEEPSPYFIQQIIDLGTKALLRDDQLRPPSYRAHELHKKFEKLIISYTKNQKTYSEADITEIKNQFYPNLTPDEQSYFDVVIERRKQKRFKVIDNAFAIFGFHNKISGQPNRICGQILDISKSGLAFTYIFDGYQVDEYHLVDIFLAGEGCCLCKMQFKTIYDFVLQPCSPVSFVVARQCGIQFRDLSDEHISKLEYFIQNYTI